MTPRERMMATLRREPVPGRVPHFELTFCLTMEAMGKVDPMSREYRQWERMTARDQEAHRRDMAELLVGVARRYEHSAILVRHRIPGGIKGTLQIVNLIREMSGDEFFIMLGGDATFGRPLPNKMNAFCAWLRNDTAAAKREAASRVDRATEWADEVAENGGVDAFGMSSDYGDASGPYISPGLFSEVVAPYLARLTAEYRARGFYTIKHCAGNIRPILDQILQANLHGLHSLDPQGGMDLASLKQEIGNRICLMGGLDTELLVSGTEEAVRSAARATLRAGMPGGGYVFGTSDRIRAGVHLSLYEAMLDVWRQEGEAMPEAPQSAAKPARRRRRAAGTLNTEH